MVIDDHDDNDDEEGDDDVDRWPSSAEELAENSNVQDAFVIAVEQQARWLSMRRMMIILNLEQTILIDNNNIVILIRRKRLEKLSALRKIKPVDMTTLSQQVFHHYINHNHHHHCRHKYHVDDHWNMFS